MRERGVGYKDQERVHARSMGQQLRGEKGLRTQSKIKACEGSESHQKAWSKS